MLVDEKKEEFVTTNELFHQKKICHQHNTTATQQDRMDKSWTRIHKSGWKSTYANREVDEKVVAQLLMERDNGKRIKDFVVADSAAAELVNMDICFNDNKHEWYTRVVGSGKDVNGVKATPVPKGKSKKKSKEKSKKKELDSSDVGAGKRKYIGKNSAANARKKKKLQGF